MATPQKTAAGNWRVQIEIAGVRESGTFPTKREAQDWAARRTMELRAMRSGRAGEIKTLGQALERYRDEVSPSKKTERLDRIVMGGWERDPAFPWRVKLADLTPFMLVAWRDERLKKVSRGTVLREMTILSSALEVARRDWGWLQSNPMRDVRRPAQPDHRERLVSRHEVRVMLRVLGWRHGIAVRSVSQAVAGAFLLALKTGMRAGELCALRWPDIYDDFARLRTSKTGKGRDVPLTPSALRTIRAMEGWDAESLFALRPQTLDAMFRKYRDKAGLAGFTFHDTRHTAATRLASRLHVLDLCRMFGWGDPKRAMTYYNPSASTIAARLRA